MLRHNEGLTKTYNRFHDPDDTDPEIARLRDLHSAMDRAVLGAYGWTDIPTDCEFLLDYEIDEEDWGTRKKPYRYRWPDEVRDEVLARLLELNTERSVTEQRSGRHHRHGKSRHWHSGAPWNTLSETLPQPSLRHVHYGTTIPWMAPTPEGIPMESKLKHLEFIQGVVNRLASDSFRLKGWAVVLVAAIFVLLVREGRIELASIGIVPVLLFWGLDGYFLWQERLFPRSLRPRQRDGGT